jgi:transcriptional regulator with XRE-family HTH domain
LEGVNPVRVFREHRKMTQRQLADAADLHQTTISQIETGERSGSVEVFLRLAKALGLDIEDLIPRASDA